MKFPSYEWFPSHKHPRNTLPFPSQCLFSFKLNKRRKTIFQQRLFLTRYDTVTPATLSLDIFSDYTTSTFTFLFLFPSLLPSPCVCVCVCVCQWHGSAVARVCPTMSFGSLEAENHDACWLHCTDACLMGCVSLGRSLMQHPHWSACRSAVNTVASLSPPPLSRRLKTCTLCPSLSD